MSKEPNKMFLVGSPRMIDEWKKLYGDTVDYYETEYLNTTDNDGLKLN